ncbi:MAG: hypothetical protein AAGH76_15055 [Pseudomonadota bacterium]
MRFAAALLFVALLQYDDARACFVPYHGDKYDSTIELQAADDAGYFEAEFPWRIDDLWVRSAEVAYYDATSNPAFLTPLQFDELDIEGNNRVAKVRFRPTFRPNILVALRVNWDVAPWVVGGCSATGTMFFDARGQQLQLSYGK